MPITRWLRAITVPADSIAARVRPLASSIEGHSTWRRCRQKASKPCVCAATKAWSMTASSPSSRAWSSSATIALHSPVSAARSPPALSWWYCVFIAVSARVSICSGDCGLAKRTRPGSFSGLNTMTGTPRSRQSCRSCSMRGALVPMLWPMMKMQSHCGKSSSCTVPTGTPMLLGSPNEVLSWHMLELSGRLLLPYRRAISAYMYEVSSDARPDA